MSKLQNLIKDLKKANQKLKEAASLRPTQINKDATIQRFEFTFELSWKAIQEYIRDQGLDCKSPKNCLREGGRLEIIENVEKWLEFLENRNLISHTYNQKTANEVYKKAVKFPEQLNALLKNINQNN